MDIKWDEEIFIQSKRIDRHKVVALELLSKNLAYKCTAKGIVQNKSNLNS